MMMTVADIDEEINEKLSTVDWNSVSMQQAQSLGVSLGVYSEAKNEVKINRDVYRTNLVSTITIMTVVAFALLLKASALTIAVGVALMLVANTFISRLQRGVSDHLVKIQKESLMQEIDALVGDVDIDFEDD